jgi:hypothetical protein
VEAVEVTEETTEEAITTTQDIVIMESIIMVESSSMMKKAKTSSRSKAAAITEVTTEVETEAAEVDSEEVLPIITIENINLIKMSSQVDRIHSTEIRAQIRMMDKRRDQPRGSCKSITARGLQVESTKRGPIVVVGEEVTTTSLVRIRDITTSIRMKSSLKL